MPEKRYGDIVGLEMWCSQCNRAHSIPLDAIIKAAATGAVDSSIIDVIGENLLMTASCIALAMAFSSNFRGTTSNSSEKVQTYALDDLLDSIGKNNK